MNRSIELSESDFNELDKVVKLSKGAWTKEHIIELLIDGWLEKLVEMNYPEANYKYEK